MLNITTKLHKAVTSFFSWVFIHDLLFANKCTNMISFCKLLLILLLVSNFYNSAV